MGQLLDIRSSSRAERQLLRPGQHLLSSLAKNRPPEKNKPTRATKSGMNFIELLNFAALQSLIKFDHLCFLIQRLCATAPAPEAEKAKKALSKKALKQMIWWKAGFVHLGMEFVSANWFHGGFTIFHIFQNLSILFILSVLAEHSPGRQLQKLCKGLANRICQQTTFCDTWD